MLPRRLTPTPHPDVSSRRADVGFPARSPPFPETETRQITGRTVYTSVTGFVHPATSPVTICFRNYGVVSTFIPPGTLVSVSVGRPSESRERAAQPSRRPKRDWGSLFFTVIALVGGFHALLMLGLEGSRLVYTSREVTRLGADIDVLQEDIRTLQAVVRHRNDLVFREQLARAQGFIQPDETRVLTRAP